MKIVSIYVNARIQRVNAGMQQENFRIQKTNAGDQAKIGEFLKVIECQNMVYRCCGPMPQANAKCLILI